MKPMRSVSDGQNECALTQKEETRTRTLRKELKTQIPNSAGMIQNKDPNNIKNSIRNSDQQGIKCSDVKHERYPKLFLVPNKNNPDLRSDFNTFKIVKKSDKENICLTSNKNMSNSSQQNMCLNLGIPFKVTKPDIPPYTVTVQITESDGGSGELKVVSYNTKSKDAKSINTEEGSGNGKRFPHGCKISGLQMEAEARNGKVSNRPPKATCVQRVAVQILDDDSGYERKDNANSTNFKNRNSVEASASGDVFRQENANSKSPADKVQESNRIFTTVEGQNTNTVVGKEHTSYSKNIEGIWCPNSFANSSQDTEGHSSESSHKTAEDQTTPVSHDSLALEIRNVLPDADSFARFLDQLKVFSKVLDPNGDFMVIQNAIDLAFRSIQNPNDQQSDNRSSSERSLSTTIFSGTNEPNIQNLIYNSAQNTNCTNSLHSDVSAENLQSKVSEKRSTREDIVRNKKDPKHNQSSLCFQLKLPTLVDNLSKITHISLDSSLDAETTELKVTSIKSLEKLFERVVHDSHSSIMSSRDHEATFNSNISKAHNLRIEQDFNITKTKRSQVKILAKPRSSSKHLQSRFPKSKKNIKVRNSSKIDNGLSSPKIRLTKSICTTENEYFNETQENKAIKTDQSGKIDKKLSSWACSELKKHSCINKAPVGHLPSSVTDKSSQLTKNLTEKCINSSVTNQNKKIVNDLGDIQTMEELATTKRTESPHTVENYHSNLFSSHILPEEETNQFDITSAKKPCLTEKQSQTRSSEEHKLISKKVNMNYMSKSEGEHQQIPVNSETLPKGSNFSLKSRSVSSWIGYRTPSKVKKRKKIYHNIRKIVREIRKNNDDYFRNKTEKVLLQNIPSKPPFMVSNYKIKSNIPPEKNLDNNNGLLSHLEGIHQEENSKEIKECINDSALNYKIPYYLPCVDTNEFSTLAKGDVVNVFGVTVNYDNQESKKSNEEVDDKCNRASTSLESPTHEKSEQRSPSLLPGTSKPASSWRNTTQNSNVQKLKYSKSHLGKEQLKKSTAHSLTPRRSSIRQIQAQKRVLPKSQPQKSSVQRTPCQNSSPERNIHFEKPTEKQILIGRLTKDRKSEKKLIAPAETQTHTNKIPSEYITVDGRDKLIYTVYYTEGTPHRSEENPQSTEPEILVQMQDTESDSSLSDDMDALRNQREDPLLKTNNSHSNININSTRNQLNRPIYNSMSLMPHSLSQALTNMFNPVSGLGMVKHITDPKSTRNYRNTSTGSSKRVNVTQHEKRTEKQSNIQTTQNKAKNYDSSSSTRKKGYEQNKKLGFRSSTQTNLKDNNDKQSQRNKAKTTYPKEVRFVEDNFKHETSQNQISPHVPYFSKQGMRNSANQVKYPDNMEGNEEKHTHFERKTTSGNSTNAVEDITPEQKRKYKRQDQIQEGNKQMTTIKELQEKSSHGMANSYQSQSRNMKNIPVILIKDGGDGRPRVFHVNADLELENIKGGFNIRDSSQTPYIIVSREDMQTADNNFDKVVYATPQHPTLQLVNNDSMLLEQLNSNLQENEYSQNRQPIVDRKQKSTSISSSAAVSGRNLPDKTLPNRAIPKSPKLEQNPLVSTVEKESKDNRFRTLSVSNFDDIETEEDVEEYISSIPEKPNENFERNTKGNSNNFHTNVSENDSNLENNRNDQIYGTEDQYFGASEDLIRQGIKNDASQTTVSALEENPNTTLKKDNGPCHCSKCMESSSEAVTKESIYKEALGTKAFLFPFTGYGNPLGDLQEFIRLANNAEQEEVPLPKGVRKQLDTKKSMQESHPQLETKEHKRPQRNVNNAVFPSDKQYSPHVNSERRGSRTQNPILIYNEVGDKLDSQREQQEKLNSSLESVKTQEHLSHEDTKYTESETFEICQEFPFSIKSKDEHLLKMIPSSTSSKSTTFKENLQSSSENYSQRMYNQHQKSDLGHHNYERKSQVTPFQCIASNTTPNESERACQAKEPHLESVYVLNPVKGSETNDHHHPYPVPGPRTHFVSNRENSFKADTPCQAEEPHLESVYVLNPVKISETNDHHHPYPVPGPKTHFVSNRENPFKADIHYNQTNSSLDTIPSEKPVSYHHGSTEGKQKGLHYVPSTRSIPHASSTDNLRNYLMEKGIGFVEEETCESRKSRDQERPNKAREKSDVGSRSKRSSVEQHATRSRNEDNKIVMYERLKSKIPRPVVTEKETTLKEESDKIKAVPRQEQPPTLSHHGTKAVTMENSTNRITEKSKTTSRKATLTPQENKPSRTDRARSDIKSDEKSPHSSTSEEARLPVRENSDKYLTENRYVDIGDGTLYLQIMYDKDKQYNDGPSKRASLEEPPDYILQEEEQVNVEDIRKKGDQEKHNRTSREELQPQLQTEHQDFDNRSNSLYSSNQSNYLPPKLQETPPRRSGRSKHPSGTLNIEEEFAHLQGHEFEHRNKENDKMADQKPSTKRVHVASYNQSPDVYPIHKLEVGYSPSSFNRKKPLPENLTPSHDDYQTFDSRNFRGNSSNVSREHSIEDIETNREDVLPTINIKGDTTNRISLNFKHYRRRPSRRTSHSRYRTSRRYLKYLQELTHSAANSRERSVSSSSDKSYTSSVRESRKSNVPKQVDFSPTSIQSEREASSPEGRQRKRFSENEHRGKDSGQMTSQKSSPKQVPVAPYKYSTDVYSVPNTSMISETQENQHQQKSSSSRKKRNPEKLESQNELERIQTGNETHYFAMSLNNVKTCGNLLLIPIVPFATENQKRIYVPNVDAMALEPIDVTSLSEIQHAFQQEPLSPPQEPQQVKRKDENVIENRTFSRSRSKTGSLSSARSSYRKSNTSTHNPFMASIPKTVGFYTNTAQQYILNNARNLVKQNRIKELIGKSRNVNTDDINRPSTSRKSTQNYSSKSKGSSKRISFEKDDYPVHPEEGYSYSDASSEAYRHVRRM